MPSAWVIEDNDLNYELVEFLLEDAGWRVERASDGAGLRSLMAGSAQPDLVLLDMNLPDASGLELAALLRVQPRLRAVPIIAVTAHAMRGDRQPFLDAGCDGYVAKPIDRDKLFAAIDEVRSGATP